MAKGIKQIKFTFSMMITFGRVKHDAKIKNTETLYKFNNSTQH